MNPLMRRDPAQIPRRVKYVTTKIIITSLATALLFVACGGGGSGGGSSGQVQGLQGPQQVTVITAGGGTELNLRLPRGVRGSTSSDYNTDRTRFWVRDNSMDALDSVNMILSFLHQTHYWEETNQGPYRALVEDTSERGEGERGGNAKVYAEWVINSKRSDNTSPQIVSFWINERDGGEEKTIYGKLTVHAEPTEEQPLGRFTLFFRGLPAEAPHNSSDTSFEGYLRTVARTDGQSEVEFYMGHGDPATTPAEGERAVRERARVVGDFAAGTGRAFTERHNVENHGGSVHEERGAYQIQFDADYLARRETVSDELEILDRHDFTTRVYRYGIYTAANGARATRNSGFPVTTQGGAYGWAGYHGIWFPPEVALTHGMTLLRRNYSNNSTTPYTLVRVPGRLEKRSRTEITFADLRNEEMQYFDPIAGAEVKARYTGSDFVRYAQRENGQWGQVQPPVSIVENFTQGQWLHFWNPTRGNVQVIWPATLNDSVTASVWTATPVHSGSPELAGGSLTLYGYSRMLRPDITQTQANFMENQSPYFPEATSPSEGNRTYLFDGTTMMLRLGEQNVNFQNGVVPSQGPGQWGLDCGPLFATPLESFEEIQDRDTTYIWTIGTNPWNQFLALKNANQEVVTFTSPLRFQYVHEEPGSPYDGRTFFLEWDGSNLQGLPYEQSDQGWQPCINVPSGTTLSADNVDYLVKQLEGEQRMAAVDDPESIISERGFDLSSSLSAPTAAPYQNPAIGPRPNVTTPPKYVGGVPANSGD